MTHTTSLFYSPECVDRFAQVEDDEPVERLRRAVCDNYIVYNKGSHSYKISEASIQILGIDGVNKAELSGPEVILCILQNVCLGLREEYRIELSQLLQNDLIPILEHNSETIQNNKTKKEFRSKEALKTVGVIFKKTLVKKIQSSAKKKDITDSEFFRELLSEGIKRFNHESTIKDSFKIIESYKSLYSKNCVGETQQVMVRVPSNIFIHTRLNAKEHSISASQFAAYVIYSEFSEIKK